MHIEKYIYLNPNVFLFAERKCFPEWHIHKRKNQFHDLTFVMEGKAVYYVNDVEYIVKAGDLLYIPSGSVREARTFKDCLMFAYPFNFHWLSNDNHIHLPFDIVNKNLITKEIIDLLREFKQVWMNQQPFYEIQAKALFQMILHRLLTRFYKQSSTLIDPRINRIIRYITDHYDEPLRISQLSEQIGLNPVYFGKLFKEQTGVSCKNYINRIRINNAQMLLASGDFTVTEAAERCGFQDLSYFSNLFKETKGFPPSAAKG